MGNMKAIICKALSVDIFYFRILSRGPRIEVILGWWIPVRSRPSPPATQVDEVIWPQLCGRQVAWTTLSSTDSWGDWFLREYDPYTVGTCIINSLTPGRFGWKFRKVILKLTLIIDDCSISSKIARRGMPLDLTDDKSTLVHVMAWCCQETSHYLSQCCPRSLSPYGVTRPQWVNSSGAYRNKLIKYHW